MSVPDNWKQFESNTSVTFVPDGAYGNRGGESVFTHGAIVGVANANSTDLMSATGQYIAGVLQGNSYLQVEGKYQKIQIGGRDGLTRRLSGNSPITNQKEIVDITTAFTNRGRLMYVVQVVPSSEQDKYKAAFGQMLKNVSFLD